MNDKRDAVRKWIVKGDNDLRTAGQSLELGGPYDTACFHCQQAAEKYLKAVLAHHECVIPKTHDLKDIHLAVLAVSPSQDLPGIDLSSLTL